MTSPGSWLRALAACAFSATTMEHVVDPAIADFQEEYASAVRHGSRLRRTWALASGYACFWRTLCAFAVDSAEERAHVWISADRWAVGHLVSSVALITSGIALVYVVPFMFVYGRRAASPLWWVAICLVPQAIAGATPPGLLFGSLWSLRQLTGTRRVRATILVAAVCAALVTFANVGWITPRANDAYRRAVVGSAYIPSRGFPELTLPEMNAAFREISEQSDPVDVGLLRLSYHARAALAVAPLLFGSLACAALARLRRQARSATVILIGFTLYVTYGLVPDWERMVATGASPTLIAWAPNALAVLLTLALFTIKPRDDASQSTRA